MICGVEVAGEGYSPCVAGVALDSWVLLGVRVGVMVGVSDGVPGPSVGVGVRLG